MTRALPSPPDAGVFNALRFGRQPLRFIEGIQARYDDGASISIPGRPPLVIVTDPTLVHEALRRSDDFQRVPAQRSAARIAENGLVQSEGEDWRRQRAIMNPAFSMGQVEEYAATTGRMVADLAQGWLGTRAETANIHQRMTSMTLRTATHILFDEDIGRRRAEEFYRWMNVAGEQFEFGLDAVTPSWIPERISPAFRTVADDIRGLAEELIDRRRASLEGAKEAPCEDMLGMLLKAQERTDSGLSDQQIRDQVATFLIAGHETTALSLTYTLCLLSWNPDAAAEVHEEATTVLTSDPPSHGHLDDLEYTRRAYLEGLRLYPPAWAVFRRVDGDVDLGKYVLNDGSALILPQWSIHRDERYFADPSAFNPDRWRDRDPTESEAFFPFASGPHACIGRQFALSGAPLTLARLHRDFEIDVGPGALDDLRVAPTLRPPDGVRATIRPRGALNDHTG